MKLKIDFSFVNFKSPTGLPKKYEIILLSYPLRSVHLTIDCMSFDVLKARSVEDLLHIGGGFFSVVQHLQDILEENLQSSFWVFTA